MHKQTELISPIATLTFKTTIQKVETGQHIDELNNNNNSKAINYKNKKKKILNNTKQRHPKNLNHTVMKQQSMNF